MQAMLVRATLTVAALGIALSTLAGCGPHFPDFNSPTGPNPSSTVDTFRLSATLSDADGVPHIIEAVLDLDGYQVGDSCPPGDEVPQFDQDGNPDGVECEAPPSASYTFNVGGGINPGSHDLLFAVTTQEGLGRYPFTVAAFTMSIHDSTGKLVKTVPFPTQTVTGPGTPINYPFSY